MNSKISESILKYRIKNNTLPYKIIIQGTEYIHEFLILTEVLYNPTEYPQYFYKNIPVYILRSSLKNKLILK